MKANNPRAKFSCFGKHSEPCFRYHQGFHSIGHSHECIACIQGDEIHHTRHKLIAENIVKIQRIDMYGESDGIGAKVELRLITNQAVQGDPIAEGERRPIDETEDNGTISSIETPALVGMSSAEKRQEKRAKKEAKSKARALRNQQRFDSGVTAKDIGVISSAIHGEAGQMRLAIHGSIADEEIIQRNIGYVAAVHSSQKHFESGSLEATRSKAKGKQRAEEVISARVHEVLHKLGIAGFETASNSNSVPTAMQPATPAKSRLDGRVRKERKTLLERVKIQIAEDIEKSDDDTVETLIRMAGYYRFANKTMFKELMKYHADWEWATGDRLDEHAEELAPAPAPEDDGEQAEAEADPEDFEVGWEEAEQLAQAAADAAQDLDNQLTAELEGNEELDIEPANGRLVLDPENNTARDNVVYSMHGTIDNMAEKEYETKEQARQRKLTSVNRILAIWRDYAGICLPVNSEPDSHIMFGNELFDWIGPKESGIFDQLFFIDPAEEASQYCKRMIKASEKARLKASGRKCERTALARSWMLVSADMSEGTSGTDISDDEVHAGPSSLFTATAGDGQLAICSDANGGGKARRQSRIESEGTSRACRLLKTSENERVTPDLPILESERDTRQADDWFQKYLRQRTCELFLEARPTRYRLVNQKPFALNPRDQEVLDVMWGMRKLPIAAGIFAKDAQPSLQVVYL